MPRIRNINPPEEITLLNSDLNTIVCEAIYKSTDTLAPTSLQWYNDKGLSLMLTSDSNNLATNVKNLTSSFHLVNANNKQTFYECCTLIGQIKHKCTKVYAIPMI